MDSSQNDSDGGGGRHGWSSASSLDRQLGEGNAQTQDSPLELGFTNGQPPHGLPVLSLDQIRISRSSNEYTEGPTIAQRSPATLQRQQKIDLSLGSRTVEQTPEERHNNLLNLHALRTSSAEDSQSSIRTSGGSVSSGQRLLSSPAGNSQIIRTQPTRSELSSEELKPLNIESRAVVTVPGTSDLKDQGAHSNKCQDCGKCRCKECTRPRMLPSCWMCGRRCVCSMPNVVEYGTCVCCVKGLFYHCSSDDEDTCADKPFSCSQQHCFVRWTTVALLSVCFPCLLCYLPAKGCLAVCQSCYDRASRPGCRCKNPSRVHREESGKLT